MAKTMGISRSFTCENKNRLRFKFSTSATTTIISGKSLSFVLSKDFRTILSSIDVGLML